MKKITSFVLIIILCFSVITPAYAAEPQENKVTSRTKDDILMEYHSQMQSLQLASANNSRASQRKKEITEQTIEQLKKLGYDAYDVNSETYDEIEEELETSFENLDLHRNYSYIIVIGEENQLDSQTNSNTREHISNTFLYTYNNKVYRMRTMTVTAADDPAYGKTSQVNLLQSTSNLMIHNCLNWIISACISRISKGLGVVMDICGVFIDDTDTTASLTLNFHGSTNWTRVYTLVYDSNDDDWFKGSCVEYAVATSNFSGNYYSAENNMYLPVSQDSVSVILETEHYNDIEWRRSTAVHGFKYSQPQYEVTGKVQYKYEDQVIITHYENF